jgi:hypothetical protein
MTEINWNTVSYYSISNFIVDKNTSKIYTGEGSNYGGSGTRIIRLKTTGIYDTFVSNADAKFEEIWELQFNCNNGDIIAMGGSTKSNLTMGTINKTAASTTISSITSYVSFQQDVVSSAIDHSGQLYVLLASYSHATPQVNNHIFKCNTTLNGNVWDKWSGYDVFVEINNKLTPETSMSNGFNCLSANANYLFYYDGEHIKAFNLSNGDSVGLPFSIPNYKVKQQGGIESDDCNNVYIGGNNGNVLVFKFDGMNFNLDRQIYINGHNGKSIHDLKASKKSNKLYVSGNGFVAETNFSNCDSAILSSTITSNCLNIAIVNISNTVGGSTFDFVWKRKATNTIVKSKSNTISMSDTLTGIAGEDYELTITRNSICLPARIVKKVTFKPFGTVHFDTVSRCQGQTYTIGAKTYTQSGVYRDTIMEYGCQKIVLTTLTIYQKTIDTIRRTLCIGDSINIKGQFIKLAGVYRDTMITLKGCDSILVYIVSTLSAYSNTNQIYDSICPNQSRLFYSQTLTSAGIYTQTFKNIYGCDSNIVLNLYVKPFISSNTNATICSNSSYLFDNRNLTTNGTYYDTIKRSGQCDSFVVLNLTVNNISTHNINRTICQGQSIQVGSNNYNSTGTFVVTLNNSLNCDSIVTLNLSVVNSLSNTLNQAICQGQSVQVGNKTFNSTGTYVEKLKNSNNCDSIVTLNLQVNPKYLFIENGVTCKGVPYRFFNQNLSSSGVFYQNYNTIHGCDSIYELRLRVGEITGLSQSDFVKAIVLKF